MPKPMLVAAICLAFIHLFACNSKTTGNTYQAQASSQRDSIIKALLIDDSLQVAGQIRSMLQDKKGNIWFGTIDQGAWKYDGTSLSHFTVQEGLCSNAIEDMLEDRKGNIWFSTLAGICLYDGKSFSLLRDEKGPLQKGGGLAIEDKRGDILFTIRDRVYRYHGLALESFSIAPDPYRPARNDPDRPYTIYCMLEDRAGNLWFGTEQRGVCRYDGKHFQYFTEEELGQGAVRCVFEDREGNIWFGSNGAGVLRYDGQSMHNFSEEMGLSKDLAHAYLEDENQKLNRIWSITEDLQGHIWFSTIDEGLWRYDGQSLRNVSLKEGLCGNDIWTILADKNGSIWCALDGAGLCRLDTKSLGK